MEQNPLADGNSASHSKKTAIIEFRGDGMEYFKIWIVNVLLTIVTLGIYSAWAKVRNNRYFYSNMYIENDNFRYLAEPMTILKGRLIAIAALIFYSIASAVSPTFGLILAVILILAIPELINRSLAFNHRMSAFKNIQFRFKASYFEAFMVMYIWPLLGMLTLGILYPMAMLKMHQYMTKNSSYGTTNFDYSATYKDYGVIFLTIIGVGIMVGLPIWAITAFIPSLSIVSVIMVAALYIGIILFFIVKLNNVFYANLSILDHRFTANLTMLGLFKVLLINTGLTIITLGLYAPAAKVRLTKYFCSCITMEIDGSLDNFAAAEKENVSALGEEFGEVFDFGI
jgi:uncharacterized membrane protein YjgN (DUF898 family)